MSGKDKWESDSRKLVMVSSFFFPNLLARPGVLGHIYIYLYMTIVHGWNCAKHKKN